MLFEGDPEPMPAWREGDRSKLETLCRCTEVGAFGHQNGQPNRAGNRGDWCAQVRVPGWCASAKRQRVVFYLDTQDTMAEDSRGGLREGCDVRRC